MKNETIELAARRSTNVTKEAGKRVPQRIRAQVIEVDLKKSNGLTKSTAEPGASNVIANDPFVNLLEQGKIVEPPFDPLTLATLLEQNSELGQCIEAMETNIDATGHRFVPRLKLDDIVRDRPPSEGGDSKPEEPHPENMNSRREKVRLNNFFNYATDETFVAFRRKLRRDLESTGNAYFEVLRNAKGDIQGFVHIPSYQMRLGVLDKEAKKVERRIAELQIDGTVQIKRQQVWKRFRVYAQSRGVRSSKIVRWFKSFGDSRRLNKMTGDYETTKVKVPNSKLATEVVHLKLYSPRSPYGLPRYIGNLLSIFGDRAAEEINYMTFRNNNIPSMVVLASNGQLTQGSIDRIKDFVDSQIQGSDNYSKFLIIEAEPFGEEGEDGGQAKIEIERLTNDQHRDALFQNYSSNNQDKIRRAFRLPPIFVGRCHSADTEYLTENGWKLFDEIDVSERLATVNEDWEVEYQTPTERFRYEYDGELLRLKNRGIDALVTHNHRMYSRPTVEKKRRERDWRFVEAHELQRLEKKGNWGYVELPTTASWSGEFLEAFEIPANESRRGGRNTWKPGDSAHDSLDLARKEASYARRAPRSVNASTFLRFLGYFVAEGSTERDRPGSIRLSQDEGPVAESMLSVVRELGFEPSVSKGPIKANGKRELSIGFSHVGLYWWLRENCGEDSSSKRLPRWALNVATEQLQILLSAMIDGDGSLPKGGSEGSFEYSTTSEVLNGQVHEMCVKLGVTFTSSRREREHGWATIWSGYGHLDRRHLIKPSKQIERERYVGVVSCFKVPNGLLVTKRNGRVLISGNSDDYTRATAEASRRLADEQIFSPERNEWDDFMNRILFPEMGVRWHTYKSNSPNTTDNSQLVKILAGAEKTGGMTPRIARSILEDVLGIDLPDFPGDFPADVPFSMTMAEAVKNKADASEPGQQVTALKALETIDKLTSADFDFEDDDSILDIAKRLVILNRAAEVAWRAKLSAEDEGDDEPD